MPALRLLPDDVCYNQCISACFSGGQAPLALELLRETKGHCAFNDGAAGVAYTSSISACAKVGQWQLAVSLLREMSKLGLPLRSHEYSAAIDACERADQWQFALSLLREMPEAQVTIGQKHYTSAILAMQGDDRWQLALSVFCEASTAVADSCSPGSEGGMRLYISVIEACGPGPVGQHMFLEGLALNMFPGLLQNGIGTLDLHELSPMTAVHATHWWLFGHVPAHCSQTARLCIITGRRKHSKWYSRRDVRGTVKMYMDSLGLKYVHGNDYQGRFHVQASDLRELQASM